MCDWVVTAPKTLKFDDYEIFFKTTYDFLTARYGLKNVISAYVHMDEVQPHLHFAFVPVAKDKKKGDFKVSAKEVITKIDLKTFHQDLSDVMQKHFGRDIGILNEATQDGNRSIIDLKRQTAIKEIEEYKKMQVDIKSVDVNWKLIPFSDNKIKVDLRDLIKIENQAKSYIVNKKLLDNIGKIEEKNKYYENRLVETELQVENLSAENEKLSLKLSNITSRCKNLQDNELKLSEENKELKSQVTVFKQEYKKNFDEFVKKSFDYNKILKENKKLIEENCKLKENNVKNVENLKNQQENINRELALLKKALKLPDNINFEELRKVLENNGLIEKEKTNIRNKGMSR
jgi:hypothetical protein